MIPIRQLVIGTIILLLTGCASTDKVADDSDAGVDSSSGQGQGDRREEGFYLEDTADEVKTVQLYREGDETSLPVITMGRSQRIILSFDVLTDDSRALSIYFYHANRAWERDLVPAEYLTSFHSDDLLNYSISQATDIHYTHYDYDFPNRSVDFTLSGNYILRVTGQGDEEDILFERPFFVSEEATALDLRLDNVLVAGSAYTSVQPSVRFTPPTAAYDPLDYTVCFMRNDQYGATNCDAHQSLAVQPDLAYYLEPENSFNPISASYFLDLSVISVGSKVEFTDLSVKPPEAALSPDYAKFPGTGLAPFLNGQSVIRSVVRNVADPDVSGEYARVYFRFVPLNERPVTGRIAVTGSFNSWEYEEANELKWIPERRWYEGATLIKQGQYEYRYLVEDPTLRRAMSGVTPSFRNLYTTFVYYSDLSRSTDRLIAATGVFVR